MEQLGGSVTTRNWQMLSSSLPGLSYDGVGDRQFPQGQSQRDVTPVGDRPDPVRALRDIHSMVAPLVLHDLHHLTCVQQLSDCVKAMQQSEGSYPQSEDVTPITLHPHIALTPAVVHAVGAEKGCQDELQVSLLMTYCFLSATLLHHLKAIGGIKHHVRESEGPTDR